MVLYLQKTLVIIHAVQICGYVQASFSKQELEAQRWLSVGQRFWRCLTTDEDPAMS